MWGPSIIGCGSYHYRYESGREGDMPLVCFSPRKSANVVYVCLSDKALLEKLGKYKLSGGCLHIGEEASPTLFRRGAGRKLWPTPTQTCARSMGST